MSVSRRQLLSTALRHALAATAAAAFFLPISTLADSTSINTSSGATQSASAEAGFPFAPPRGRFIYTITRDGDPIGTQKLDFLQDGSNRLTVITDVEIDVRMLGLSFYKFTQHIEEHWVDGELQAMLSETNDDGEERTVDLTRKGDRLQGKYNEKTRDIPGDIIPSTLWHPDAIRQKTVLDTVRARQHQVVVDDKGEVPLILPVGQVEARHYSFTGELNRDVWYGPDGIILQAEMKAKDGSVIRQQLLDRP
ncbi:DUF6134 family protein [Dongia sp.]|uniref:DUF6134 family protein n=1 Tax=Dongia sp. TaxID=1977262 RepID=UPI0035B130C1